MKVAVIPARGGSKRIPRKNIKPFCGKPMIAWSIEAALQSDCFDRVIVSTDDPEIAEVALRYKASIPFMRPDTLADDYIGTIPVISHAIDWLSANGDPPEQVCCIYATAPFVTGKDICNGLNTLLKHGCDYAFSVTSYAFPIQRAIRVNKEGRMEMFAPEYFETRSQDLEEAYHDAGQFYWGRAEAWREGRSIFGLNSSAVFLPRHRVQDIDTLEDWVRAEWLFKTMQMERSKS
ncbi:pseudaminic acid cytidylyltransferase [Pseudomonas sp. JZ134]|uniref:pseudaminic acid cytidylyltransferase n=1 Tax=Pseudomonas sp. JZ134 TaxID=2806615 RepID=UPI003DA0A994